MRYVALALLGLVIGAVVGYGIGLSEPRELEPTEVEVAALRWELDTLEGKTRAGLERCRRVEARLQTMNAALGAGE